MIFKKLIQFIWHAFRRQPPFVGSNTLLAYINIMRNKDPRFTHSVQPLILFYGLRDAVYGSLFTIIAQDVEKMGGVRAGYISTDSFNLTIGKRLHNKILRWRPIGFLFSKLWRQLYNSMQAGCFYDACDPRIKHETWMSKKADSLWTEFQYESDGPVSVRYAGIEIYDLVVDTFLRFKPSAAFKSDDPFVGKLLLQAVLDIHHLDKIFASNDIAVFVTSNTTYTQQGIAVRLAQKHQIPVLSFGNENRFGKQHEFEDVYHVIPSKNYKSEFKAMSKAKQALALESAYATLEAKFSGAAIKHMRYMRMSAFNESAAYKNEKVGDVVEAKARKGDVVVFLHDFYDSPHCCEKFIFSDFWEWITFVINNLRANGISFCIKPHPNQIQASSVVINQLNSHYPDVPIINANVSNSEIFSSGIVCGVTAYGSVAHELAYFGIPSISCAINPHFSFKFTKSALSKSEYADFLKAAPFLKLNHKAAREEVAMFYYMHHLNLSSSEAQTLSIFLDLKYMSAVQVAQDSSTFVEKLALLRSKKAYRDLISNLHSIATIESRILLCSSELER